MTFSLPVVDNQQLHSSERCGLILAAIPFTSQIGHGIVQNMPGAYWTNNLDVLATQPLVAHARSASRV